MDGNEKDERALIRLFIGIPIGEEVRGRLTKVGDRLRRTRAHVGWVPPRNYHLSLVFLGDTPRELLPELGEALDDAVGCGPFTFEVAGIGTFGSRRSPRVIWAGVDAPAALASLYESLRDNLEALGLSTDARPFRPHITLGRVRSGRGKAELTTALEQVKDSAFGSVTPAAAQLYRSVLQPGGSVYTVLHASGLIKPHLSEL